MIENRYSGLINAKIAGKHLLLDLWGVNESILANKEFNENLLKESARKACASILNTHFYQFDEGEGLTGLIFLAESHISVHTWPEVNLATIDIYMCGNCNPKDCVDIILNSYKPKTYELNVIPRGIIYNFESL